MSDEIHTRCWKECPRRSPDCHSTCGIYIHQVEENNRLREKRRLEESIDILAHMLDKNERRLRRTKYIK
ncbi:MAG: hypothetical protein Q4C42_11770 [Clostridia bacterium]|nr:hypothetical protein [Clostridia bacterium]